MYCSHFSTKKIEYIPKYFVRPGSLEMLYVLGHSTRIHPSRKLQSFSRYDWSFQNLSFFVILFLIFRFFIYTTSNVIYCSCHPQDPLLSSANISLCFLESHRPSHSVLVVQFILILLLSPSIRHRTQDRAHIPLVTQIELGKDMWSRSYN